MGKSGNKAPTHLDERDRDRIIQMAWEDRTPFDAIALQFGMKEDEVKALMRAHLKPSSYKLWRKRVQGRPTKHRKRRPFRKGRFKSTRQKDVSG